jgi:hypothetical protein
VFKDEYFKKIKELGFNHVRIPIKWETPERTATTPPYIVNEAFKNRIKYVVDFALKEGLTAIINFHHHDELVANPSAPNKERFFAQWTQVADFFKGYDNRLVFEVLNEPNAGITPEIWNSLFSDALKIIRVKNPNRPVLMGTALYGGLAGLGPLRVPTDGNVIVSVHYYNPFNFTHQGAEWVQNSSPWLGTTWDDTEIERQVVKDDFETLVQFGKNNNVPVHLGEFGAYSKADIKSRERWTTFIARYLESLDIPWTYWEWSAGFGVWDPDRNSLVSPIANALTKNPLTPATTTSLIPVYTSDFINNQGEWSLNAFNGAEATKTVQNGELTVNTTKLGSASWNVQLTKNSVKLEEGKTYRLSFQAKSTTNNVFTYYAGKNSDPYNSYSGYPSASLNNVYKEYSTIFKMTSPTDPAARIVMDLGGSLSNATFKSIKLEEVKLVFTNVNELKEEIKLELFPNPSKGELNVKGIKSGDIIMMVDQSGRIIDKHNTVHDSTSFKTYNLSKGNYFIKVERDGIIATKAFIKAD